MAKKKTRKLKGSRIRKRLVLNGPALIEQLHGMRGAEATVYLMMLMRCDASARCRLPLPVMVEETGMHLNTMFKAVHRLIESGKVVQENPARRRVVYFLPAAKAILRGPNHGDREWKRAVPPDGVEVDPETNRARGVFPERLKRFLGEGEELFE